MTETYLIFFEDPDKPAEIFSGAGAEFAARWRYAQALGNWTCHLFGKLGPTIPTAFSPIGKVSMGRCAKCGGEFASWNNNSASFWITQYGTLCTACKAEVFPEPKEPALVCAPKGLNHE